MLKLQYQEAEGKQECCAARPIRRDHDCPIHGVLRQAAHPDMSQVGDVPDME